MHVQYEPIAQIGTGAFGTVALAHNGAGLLVAVKATKTPDDPLVRLLSKAIGLSIYGASPPCRVWARDWSFRTANECSAMTQIGAPGTLEVRATARVEAWSASQPNARCEHSRSWTVAVKGAQESQQCAYTYSSEWRGVVLKSAAPTAATACWEERWWEERPECAPCDLVYCLLPGGPI